MNRKGIAPIIAVLAIAGFFILVYIILLIPIPAFEKIRWSINYIFIIIMFFAVQVLFFYLYFKFSAVLYKGYIVVREKLENITKTYKNLLKA